MENPFNLDEKHEKQYFGSMGFLGKKITSRSAAYIEKSHNTYSSMIFYSILL